MENKQTILPKWILIVSGLIAIIELSVSFLICFSPQSVIETIDLSAGGVSYLISMWSTRQFALGFIFAFATYKRSVPMLTLSYVFFLVMFIGDLCIGAGLKDSGLMVSALVMSLFASFMLYKLNKHKTLAS